MSSEILKQVLIVDDQENWRIALKDILESEGYEVFVTNGLEAAKELLNRIQFDLAVLDVRLVDEQTYNNDGLILLDYINKYFPRIKTLVATGYSENIIRKPKSDEFVFKIAPDIDFDEDFRDKVKTIM